MTSAICTLFEGDYHYGVGALLNSVVNNGFTGVAYIGYRGNLPPWVGMLPAGKTAHVWNISPDCQVQFIKVETSYHFSTYKPAFMRLLWEKHCPEVDSLFYFDPDITIKCRWSFYDAWVRYGVALCEDSTYPYMPTDHPHRLAWRMHASSFGFTYQRDLSRYYNSGFIGIHEDQKELLCVWQELMDSLPSIGVDLSQILNQDRSQVFFTLDQDVLNMSLMATSMPISTIGPDGMDFISGGYLMSHAIGIKPWRKDFIRLALHGAGPSMADKQFVSNAVSPIPLYGSTAIKRMKWQVATAALIGRFIQRR